MLITTAGLSSSPLSANLVKCKSDRTIPIVKDCLGIECNVNPRHQFSNALKLLITPDGVIPDNREITSRLQETLVVTCAGLRESSMEYP